jgi:hypothetical protein
MSLERFTGVAPHLITIDLSVRLVNAFSVHHYGKVVIFTYFLHRATWSENNAIGTNVYAHSLLLAPNLYLEPFRFLFQR